MLEPLSASQREALEEAVASYVAAATPQAARWLTQRGISPETALGARLGVASDPAPGHARFTGMLAIPYLNRTGDPLTVRFRCLEEHDHREHFHGKYNSIKDDPTRVYNVGAIHRAGDTICITEGELDTLILTQLGLHSVAIPGANSWKGHHRKMLAGFNKILVFGDGDEAGAEFSNKITRQMRNATAIKMPTGLDVTDLFLRDGAQAVIDLIPRKGV